MREAKQRRNLLLAITGIGAVIIVVALVLVGELTRGSEVVTPSHLEHVGRTLGSPTAPVTLEAWEDFQCHFCKQANSTILSRIIDQYVSTGQVKIVYRHYAFLGRESVRAAEASECAAEQGQFWAYHDVLFANQSSQGSGVFSDARLKRYAAEIGLDEEAFNACFDSGRNASAIEFERREGESLGVDSTPTFFINGRRITGAQPYALFESAIQAALEAR